VGLAKVGVLVCDPIGEDGVQLLRRTGLRVDVETALGQADLLKKISGYEVIVVRSRTKVTKEVIEAGTNLRIIARAGVGLDNVDVEAAESKGLIVLNAPEAASNAVAELAIGLILAVLHKLSIAKPDPAEGLTDKTLGVIGLGRIGFLVAHKLKSAFGVKPYVYDPKPSLEKLAKLQTENSSLETLLPRSDMVTIHVPLIPETHHLLDKRRISSMKDGAILVNTSRGGVVDEGALLRALESGKLRGAALDVFEHEPAPDPRLVRLPNFVGTPHIGAQTMETQEEVSRIVATKILESLKTTTSGNP